MLAFKRICTVFRRKQFNKPPWDKKQNTRAAAGIRRERAHLFRCRVQDSRDVIAGAFWV